MLQPISNFMRGILTFCSSLFPFSLASIVLPLFIVGVVFNFIHNIFKKDIVYAVIFFLNTAVSAYFSFILLFGVNYYAEPVYTNMPYSPEPQSIEMLNATAEKIVNELNNYASIVTRNADGTVTGYSFSQQNKLINTSMRKVMQTYGINEKAFLGRVKPAGILSVPMSYFGIAGFIFPHTGEANVSTDSPAEFLPFTAAHEQAHTIGIAPEDEAGFLSWLTCIESGDPELVYSALLNAYLYTSNALSEHSYDNFVTIYNSVDELARGDLDRYNEHLSQYDTPVNDIGTAINDTFLKSNGQISGVNSYGDLCDLLISYYNYN